MLKSLMLGLLTRPKRYFSSVTLRNHPVMIINLLVFSFALISPYNRLLPQVANATIVGTSPPASGTWWIDTQNTTVEDEVIILNGSINIATSYNLTLRNVTLKMNSTSSENYWIIVNNGAALYMENCTVTAYDINYAWHLDAYSGSTILLNDSAFSYAGTGLWGSSGLHIGTDNAQIINCTIQANYFGLYIDTVNNTLIANTTVTDSYDYGIHVYNSNNTVLTGNTVTNSGAEGIDVYTSNNNTIQGNSVFNSSGVGLLLSDTNHNLVSKNTIRNSTQGGISLDDSGNSTVSENTVTNSSQVDLYSYYSGIYLTDSGNSTVRENTITFSSPSGIYLTSCDNSTVSANTVTNSSKAGIRLYNSNNCTILNNTITNSSEEGMYLTNFVNSTISGNIVTNSANEGIYLRDSNNITVMENDVSKSSDEGIRLYDAANSTISENTVSTSLQGISLFRSSKGTISNNTLLHNDYEGIYLWFSSDNSTVSNNSVRNNPTGISVHTSRFCTVNNNIIFNSSQKGISLYDSSNSTVSYNDIANSSQRGINLDNSSYSIVSTNIVANTSQQGVYLSGDTFHCKLWDNTLALNGLNAYDSNGTNQWDNGTHGNWWDDYTGADTDFDGIGDSPYAIGGTGGAEDRYPLMEAPGVDIAAPALSTPADIDYAEGSTGYNITWNAYDRHPGTYNVTRNGTLIANDTWTAPSIVLQVDGLPFGNYTFMITVYDTFGNFISDTVVVRVLDESLPVLDSPLDVRYVQGDDTKTISWTATDNYPASYTIYRDGVEVENGLWISGDQIIVNISGLAIGDYNFTIVVEDQSGNKGSDSVIVTVLKPEEEDDAFPLLLVLGIGGGAILAVVAAIGIFYRRYKS
ncbi:MAG: nitrous oxide reductase family maturation protein NosD [Candidatus Heimdallarchaeota archaeon]